jgi:hypothetical protein
MVAPSQQVYSDYGIALDGGRLIPHRPYAEAVYAAVKIEATCKYVRGWGMMWVVAFGAWFGTERS